MNTRGRVGEEWIFGVPSTTTLRGTLLYLRGHRHASVPPRSYCRSILQLAPFCRKNIIYASIMHFFSSKICTIDYFVVPLQALLKGKMAEWSIAAVLKTVDPKGFGGSNPSLSAGKSFGAALIGSPKTF